MWDSSTGKKAWSAHPLKHPSRIAFDRSGQLLAIKNTLGEIVILDANSGELACELTVPDPCEGSNICFTKDGDLLISGTWDGRLEKYRVSDGKLVDSINFDDQMVTQILPVRSHQEFAVMHGRYGKRNLTRFPASPWVYAIETAPLPDHTAEFAILPDGTLLVMRRSDILLRNGDVQTVMYESEESIFRFCLNISSDFAAIVHADMITIVDISARTEYSIFELPFACAVDFSPVADELAVGSANSGVIILSPSEVRNTA